MSTSKPHTESLTRTDDCGRPFVCEATSPDGAWHVEVFGGNERCNFHFAYAYHGAEMRGSFPFGPEVVNPERISFRWDLPNGSWGVYIDGKCWAIYTYRPAARMHPERMLSHAGPHAPPFTEEEIRCI